MSSVLSPEVASFVDAVGGEDHPVVVSMEEHASETDFPILGRAAGRVCRLLAGLAGADRVFEFGSGFGYSAYWFAQGIGADGEVVCTDLDADRIERGRSFMAAAGIEDRVTFEHGDALAVFEETAGPVDIVLVDHEKESYREALEAVRPRLSPGGLVVADNAMTAGIVDFPPLADRMHGGDPELDPPTAGVAAYLEAVSADPAFETVVVPVGEGLAVSRRRADTKG